MNALLTYLQNNGTKILGLAQGTIAVLAGIAGVIPESQLKYWMAASAVLTFWRGTSNTQAIATVVTQQHATAIAAAAASGTAPVLAPAGKLSTVTPEPPK